MKGVFEISGASHYDDLIAERYHFPRIYLRAAEPCVGDWIVNRETGSAGGRKAYVAVGVVQSIDPAWNAPGRHRQFTLRSQLTPRAGCQLLRQ